MDVPRTRLPDRDLYRAEQLGVRTPGASGRPGDPLGDPTAALRGATIAGLARQLATTWNTVWSHIKPCLQAASDAPARFAGVRVFGPPSLGSASKDTALCAADLHVCHLG